MGDTLVLLNARAGTFLDAGAERVQEELLSALKGRCERSDIRLLRPHKLIGAIHQAARSSFTTVIVGGGDGSASCAANAFARTRITLGVLPFGTINLLARDLGMPPDVHEAIAALGQAQKRTVDLARVNGRAFHSLSGLGFFSQMARAREEVRGHRFGRMFGVGMAAFCAMQRSGAFALDINVDGKMQQVEALAVLVTNNCFGQDWRRPALNGGVMEVHIVDNDRVLSKLRASADLLSGAWRTDDNGIRSVTARHISIAGSRSRAWAATDGELRREKVPLVYDVMPAGLIVLSLPPFAEQTGSIPRVRGTGLQHSPNL